VSSEELFETIQQCDESEMAGALKNIRDACDSSAEFLELVGDPIVSPVVPFEDGAPVETIPTLVFATGCQSLAAVQFLLGQGCDPNTPSSLSGPTALHMAACLWDFDAVNMLIRCVL